MRATGQVQQLRHVQEGPALAQMLEHEAEVIVDPAGSSRGTGRHAAGCRRRASSATCPERIHPLSEVARMAVSVSVGHPWRARLAWGAGIAVVLLGTWMVRWTERGSVKPLDLLLYFYPIYEATYGRIAAGQLPLWNPYQLCGIPWLATLQGG